MKKRLLAMLLVVCILCSLLPVSVMAEADNTLPEPKSISLSTMEITAPGEIDVVVEMDGDINEIEKIEVFFMCYEAQKNLRCLARSYYYKEGEKVPYADGKLHGKLQLTEYKVGGVYYLQCIIVTNNQGERQVIQYIGEQITSDGVQMDGYIDDRFADVQIIVHETNPDYTPPEIHSIELKNEQVVAPGTVEVIADISDDKCGVQNCMLTFSNKESGDTLNSWPYEKYWDSNVMDSVPFPDGKFHGTIEIAEDCTPGEYVLTSVNTEDNEFNGVTYGSDGEPLPDFLQGITFTVFDRNSPYIELDSSYTVSGESASISVHANDAVSYQWYIKNAGKEKFSKSSVTSDTYTTTMSSKSKDRQVYCEVTDSEGNIYITNTVTLKMAATVTTQPKNTYVKSGSTAKVSLKAEGDELTYQWYIKNAGSKKYSKSSVTSSTYSCKMNEKSKDRYIYCVVTDKYGNTAKSKTIVLREAVSIVTEPKTGYAQSGKTVKVSVEASGDELTYQWYIKNAGGSKYSKSSITSATYSAKMSDKVHGRRVYCVVTDKYGKTVQSKTVLLRMAATITTQPKNVTVAKGETAKVKVTAVGDELTYQWYIKNEGASKFSKSSVTKATYSVKMSDKVDGRQVYCVVTDKYGKTAKSNTVTLSMSVPAIYINKSGTKYHYDPDCAGKSAYEVTLSEAIAAGRTPCSKCVG